MPARPPMTLHLMDSPGHLIRRAQRIHTELWSNEVGSEVTGPQYAALVAVAGWAGVDQKTVGEIASLDKSTCAGVVRRLERKELIARRRDPEDARRRILELTDAGLAAIPDLTTRARRVQRTLLKTLSDNDSDDLIRLLRMISGVSEIAELQKPQRSAVPTLAMSATPGYLIRRAQQVHSSLWSNHFGQELTGPQYAVLVAVADAGTIDQVAIGERASLDSSTVAEMMARLSDSGWIEREPSPEDRRRMMIALSARATTALPRITATVLRVQDELLHALDGTERVEFVRLMRAVARCAPSESSDGDFEALR